MEGSKQVVRDRLRVLLVDDSPGFLQAASRVLAGVAGVDVVGCAASGAEAVGKAQALRPDVVAMDAAMPGMNGFDATRRLKALPYPPIVIVVSLNEGAEYEEAARDAGAEGFLSKTRFAEGFIPLALSVGPGA